MNTRKYAVTSSRVTKGHKLTSSKLLFPLTLKHTFLFSSLHTLTHRWMIDYIDTLKDKSKQLMFKSPSMHEWTRWLCLSPRHQQQHNLLNTKLPAEWTNLNPTVSMHSSAEQCYEHTAHKVSAHTCSISRVLQRGWNILSHSLSWHIHMCGVLTSCRFALFIYSLWLYNYKAMTFVMLCRNKSIHSLRKKNNKGLFWVSFFID